MGVEMQVAGAVLGAMASQKQAKAYEMEAQAYQEQAELASLQAQQQEAERNRMLRTQLASLGTSMSSQGVSLGTSASVSALRDDEIKMAKNDISSIKLMGMSNRRKYEISSAGSRASASAVRLGGFAKTGSQLYSINKGVG